MIGFLILIIPACFSRNYPETKKFRDGVFTWPFALEPSRKIWKWLKFPSISFNFTDINLTQITEQYLINYIDFNINDMIKELLEDYNDTYQFKSTPRISKIKNQIKPKFSNVIKSIFIRPKSKSPYISNCDAKEYPNVNLVFGGDPGEYDCKTLEDTLGQFFSYLLMIMPLFLISLLSIIFYFIFAFGRFFCFKPNAKIEPKIYEIVLFSLISFILLFSIIYNFSGSVFFVTKFRYLLNGDIMSDFSSTCENVSPSMKSSLQDSVNKLYPSIDNVIFKITKYINVSYQSFNDLIHETVKKLSFFVKTIDDIDYFCEKYNSSIQEVENSYHVCALSSSEVSFNTCPNETSLLQSIYFNESSESIKKFQKEMHYAVQIYNFTDYIDEVADDLNEIINNNVNDLKKEMDPNKMNFINSTDCNSNEIFEFLENVPSFTVPLVTTILILTPILMLVILAAQIYSFWFPGKFSRIFSFLCIPCGFCTICQFIIGSIGTIFGIAVIFYNMIYIQGDDVIDSLVKKVTNEERIIHFGLINMEDVTDEIIGTFLINDIKMKKIEFIKNLMDAKVKSKMSDIINIENLPIEETAKMIESTINNLASTMHFDRYLFEEVMDSINNYLKDALPKDLSNIASINILKSRLNSFMNNVKCCEDEKTNVSKIYNSFIFEFNNQVSNYSQDLITFKQQMYKVPDEIAVVATEFLSGLLNVMSSALSKAVRELKPILASFDVSWAIGSFNVFRSKFLHPLLLGCLYLSISAHLYIISMALMTMLLWFRRRGMGTAETYETINFESIKSESSASFNNLIN